MESFIVNVPSWVWFAISSVPSVVLVVSAVILGGDFLGFVSGAGNRVKG